VGRMLRRDFEKFGVHLPPGGQARLAHLTDAALQLGMRFGASRALLSSLPPLEPQRRVVQKMPAHSPTRPRQRRPRTLL